MSAASSLIPPGASASIFHEASASLAPWRYRRFHDAPRRGDAMLETSVCSGVAVVGRVFHWVAQYSAGSMCVWIQYCKQYS